MLRVAGCAFIDRGDLAMRSLPTYDLVLHVSVAFQALRCQIRPQRIVTLAALFFEAGM